MPKPKRKGSYWHSKISSYQDCPRKFKYQYQDFIPEPGAKSADLLFGSAMHQALEAMVKGEKNFVEIFQLYWEIVQTEDVKYNRYDWNYLNETGPILLKKFHKAHLKHLEPIQIEQRIYGRMGDTPYEGTFDVYGTYKGVPSIIDFKTAGYPYDKDKALTAEQLEGYANLGLQQDPPLKAEQVVYFVLVKSTRSVQKPLIKSLTKQDLNANVKNTEAWIKKIKADKVYPMNKNACIKGTIRCPYIDVCYGRRKSGTE